MTFRTQVKISKLPFEIGHSTPSLLLGSCFAENIGTKLLACKLPALVNPFGVVYNPHSVGNCIDTLLDNRQFAENDLEFANELWFSYSHHSKFSSPSKDECLNRINSAIAHGYKFLKGMKFLIVTFGTARTYQLKSNGQIVANCHKTPASSFVEQLMEVDQIVAQWTIRLNRLLATNPNLITIFTISPIRHWKDGAASNQLSKATLLLAAHKLVAKFPSNTFYFPSYEIMMDDLRDYRFYTADMLHPSPVAIDYIWEKFMHATMGKDTLELIEKIEKLQKAAAHRPFNPNTTSHRDFVQQNMDIIRDINRDFPEIDFTEEISALTGQS